MVPDPKLGKCDRALRGFPRSVLSRILKQTRCVPAILACCAFGSVQVSADEIPGPATAPAPLSVYSAYGVNGLVLWLAADSGVTLDKNHGVGILADKTGNFFLTPNNASQ